MVKLIVYDGQEDGCIVCIPETEKETIRIFFTEGGRNITDYDRKEMVDVAIEIRPVCRID
jgi:hypothetical protein